MYEYHIVTTLYEDQVTLLSSNVRCLTPDLEILDSITVLVLCGSLPGNDVSTKGREARLEDVLVGQSCDRVALGCINDGCPG